MSNFKVQGSNEIQSSNVKILGKIILTLRHLSIRLAFEL